MMAPKRSVGYTWRLREVMAQHGMFQTTDLVEPLRERDIDLSPSQVHRLVTGVPERLSLHVLAALCDIFGTDPGELIDTTAENVGVRSAAAGDRPAPADIAGLRPKRARITPAE
ncbi:helix-turn-helix domain-containing protein [Amycolatopsis sp. cmx-4-61]|uniref:helix-turn-helix domain-containing protein n=1 Tax=Amycolatopsis sp. cmx-4-61 TaxID=2790937 RepID=UPI00397D7C8A